MAHLAACDGVVALFFSAISGYVLPAACSPVDLADRPTQEVDVLSFGIAQVPGRWLWRILPGAGLWLRCDGPRHHGPANDQQDVTNMFPRYWSARQKVSRPKRTLSMSLTCRAVFE